jgi:hypothetical protein
MLVSNAFHEVVGLTLPSEKEPLPRTVLGIIAATTSSSSEDMGVSSGKTAATDFPLLRRKGVVFFGAFPTASQVAVTFL